MFEAAFEELGEADLQLGLAIALTIGIGEITFKVVPSISRNISSQLQVSAAIYSDVAEPNQVLLVIVLCLSIVDVLIDSLLSNARLYALIETH